MLATEFLNRNIHLSAHIDMAWLLRHTMSKPFTCMSWHINNYIDNYIMPAMK